MVVATAKDKMRADASNIIGDLLYDHSSKAKRKSYTCSMLTIGCLINPVADSVHYNGDTNSDASVAKRGPMW